MLINWGRQVTQIWADRRDGHGDSTLSLRYVSICCVAAGLLGPALFMPTAANAADLIAPGASVATTVTRVRPAGLDWTHKVWPTSAKTADAASTPAAEAAPVNAPPPPEFIPASPNPNAEGHHKKQFATFQRGACSFPGVKNPSSCDRAQSWAIAQVSRPSQGWSYLCLSFVTHAYGRSAGAPSASAMWDGLAGRRKHEGDTAAPPGALMFWGPNHVALSLGNHMLISTDILGSGNAYVVSYSTMQSVWNLPYLGWSEPDFS